MKKKVIIGILVSAFMCFGAACNKDGNGTSNFVPIHDYSSYSLPTPITSEVVNMTNDNTKHAKLFDSTIEGKKIVYNVNVKDLGAKGDGVTDDYNAIKSALDQVSDLGGGTVLMPVGNYMVKKQLIIPANCTLRGEFISSNEEGFSHATTIFVGTGKGNNGKTAQDAFIRVCSGSKLSNLNIYYPDQNSNSPYAYPYTIANGEYYGYTVENVNIINPYKGFLVSTHNVVLFNNVTMSPIEEGGFSDVIYDVPRFENVTLNSKLWKDYNKEISGQLADSKIDKFVSEATGLRFGRNDWVYIYNLNIDGLNTGLKFETSTNGNGKTNGQIYNYSAKNVKYGISLEASGTLTIVYGDIEASQSAVDCGVGFGAPTVIYFNKCDFSSEEITINNGGDGALVFTECTFKDWGECVFENLTYGYVMADCCKFLKEDNLIAHIGQNVVSSSFVNCTYAVDFPTLFNESTSEGVGIINVKVNESIPAISTPKTFEKEYRTAKSSNLIFASDFGAVADGSLITNSSATDNTIAIQKALNYAQSIGGGIVYLADGYYYVKDYLVIPKGVELRGISETNRHFGIGKKGVVLVTGKVGEEKQQKPLISMDKESGLTGISIFYENQDYKNVVEYTPTVFVAGDDCYIYNVTIPNAYIGVLVKGKNVHIDYLRTLGLNTCLALDGADNAYVENIMLTGGDWQDGDRQALANNPPSDWWTNFPNYYNDGIYIVNSNNVTLFECFTFGMGNGLHLDGSINNLVSIGLGIDAASNAYLFENSGNGNVFINNELVGSKTYINTSSKYSGSSYFYDTDCWYAGDIRLTFDGNGQVYVQQCEVQNGGFDVNTSKTLLQNCSFDENRYYMVSVSDSANGYVINSIGTINLFKLEGESKNFVNKNNGKR